MGTIIILPTQRIERYDRDPPDKYADTEMTANQYRAHLATLGLTQARAADFLGISIRTSHGYANGEPVPISIAKLLRLMVRLELKPNDVR